MAQIYWFKKLKTQIYITLLFLISLALFPIAFLFCVPIYLFRFVVSIARKLLRPDLGNLITTRSAVIATDDPATNPSWNLCVWLTLEGNLDFKQFQKNFLNDIVLKKNSNGESVYPEYQQFYHKWIGFLFWKWEEEFNIYEHMRYYFPYDKNPQTKVTTEDELKEIVKTLTALPFQRGKSPWEFLFIPNYMPNGDTFAGKSILIFRIHHGLGDGYFILKLLMGEVNKVNIDRVAQPSQIKRNIFAKALQICLFWIQAPYTFTKLIIKSRDTNEWHLPIEKLKKPFNTSFTPRISLEHIKEIKNSNNVSFTAVVLASLTGGLRNMMIEKGVKIPAYMTTAIAVPMPGHPNKLCNHFTFSFMSLPVGISDPLKRLAKVEKKFQKLKRSPLTLFSFALVPLFGGLFTWMIDWFSRNEFTTVLTSNFPGPPEAIHFIGGGGRNKIVDMNFSGGLGVGNCGIGFCMISYDHGMRIITCVDKSILPDDEDVDKLNDKILEEFEMFK